MSINWATKLQQVRHNLGAAPRRFGWLRRFVQRLRRPRWLKQNERPELEAILAQQDAIWQQGEVVWGAVIWASEGLLQPGIDDLPAVVLYSWESQCESNLMGLVQAAGQLMHLSQAVNLSEPDTQLPQSSLLPIMNQPTNFADVDPLAGLPAFANSASTGLSPRARLRQELLAPSRYEVPRALTAMVAMVATTVLVRRMHLPQRRITNGYFPLLVSRETGTAIVVPSRYWTKTIVEDWAQLEMAKN
jgi:hypothetical protein